MNTKKVAQIGMLSSAALILHLVETWLPVPAPVPGIKLGLANCVSLVTLAVLGIRYAFYLTVIRILLGALIGGILFGPAFVMSAAGGSGSILAMWYASQHWKPPFSVIGVSIIGAVAHSVIQVAAAAWLVSSESLLWYVPYVVLLAIPAGAVTGLTVGYFTDRLSICR
jgi:heptaprenyl diphosphate synthase